MSKPPPRRGRILDYLVDQGRLAEWACAGVMAAFAITLLLPGDTVGRFGWPAYRSLPLGDDVLGGQLLALAAARLAALWINGRWAHLARWRHVSPWVRIGGAMVGVGVFGGIAGLFAVTWTIETASVEGWPVRGPTTAIGAYAVLAVVDLVSCWRAGADAQRMYQACRGGGGGDARTAGGT